MKRKVIDNRYKILKKLGTGATGIVYRIRDLKNNKIVALKILSKKKISAETVQRFKREFRLLAGLRHPNLCSVYDFGTLKDGRSYFTMEYVDGPNIFEFTKKLPYEKIYPVRKDISNGVYPLIVQLCRVLEYIHSKGLIHYDIKPGNILIHTSTESNDRGVVKLMDFGLAREQCINGGILIRGTLPYIAPEVIKGLPVDHRADLYSLGVLIYELFTRELVKLDKKDSFSSLLQQSIQLSSTLPSKIITDISGPSGLERLIIKLIDAESAGRLSRANEIIKEINKFSRSKFTLETEKTIEGYLLSSRFVGRDKEMEVLTSLYEKTRRGEGKVVLITGDAGIGKSRLLNEFKIFVQLERSPCFMGYVHRDKTQILEPFHDIFKELINYLPIDSKLSREIRFSLAVLFKIFPDLTDGKLKRHLPRLVPLEPQAEKLRTLNTLTELVRFVAAELGAMVILLEDLHWADDLSIQFLEYLGRNLENRNIFICGICRKEELKGNLVLKRMTNLRNEDCFNEIELRSLKFRSLYSFLDSIITSESNSVALTKYLMKKTGGNPFFVEEIMRTLLRKRRVNIGERVAIEDLKQISIPGTIEEIVLKGVKNMDSNSQKVIKFAAVLLKSFDYNLMKRLTGFEDVELSKALWELKRNQILIEEGNKYRFYHATLREAVNKRMAYSEKRKLYYQTGMILELIYKTNTEKVVEDLAYYFINAKDSKKGVQYGLQAARKSSERYADEQAIRFYRGVLSLLGDKDPIRRFDILQKLANTEVLVGYYDDAIKHYKKALSLKTGTIYKKIKIYLGISTIYGREEKNNKMLHNYQRASRILNKMKSGRLKALLKTFINIKICRAHQVMGNYKSVNKFNFDALRFPKDGLKKQEAIRLQGMIYHSMGIIEHNKCKSGKGDYDKAISYWKKAYKYYKKIKYERGIANVLNNLGADYTLNFDYQKAFDYYHKAIQMSKKIVDPSLVSTWSCNYGIILTDKGCYSKALDYYQTALSISKKIGNPLIIGGSFLGFGECFLDICNYKKAKEYYDKALKIFDTIGRRDEKIHAIGGLGNVYQTMGDYTSALKFYRKALKISIAIGYQLNIALSFSYIGILFMKIGEFSKAKKYIKDALKIATSIGAQKVTVDCYKHLCRMSIVMKNYATGHDFYRKGIKLAEESGMRQRVLQFLLLISEICYQEKKYLKGVKIADKAKKMAKEMGTKDLHTEALLVKVRNEIEQGTLSKIEIIGILNEAKKIAVEISCPEILWRVYFEYGKFLQYNKIYAKALEYYDKCHRIFIDVGSKIKNESYRHSYLDHPDRQAVFSAVREIKKLI